MNQVKFFTLMFPIALIAAEYPFVCEWKNISQFAGDRFIEIAGSSWNPSTVIDKQTISLDEQNGIIKVWEIELASPKQRSVVMNHFQGDQNDYSDYGYTKVLMAYKYKSFESKGLAIVRYKCNGDVISSVKNPNANINDGFDYVIPGTEGEGKLKEIKRVYNLK